MQKWSLNFRLWHWINALVVMGLVGTVLLRKSFLSWRTNSEIIIQKLSEINIDITAAQAKVVAKAIRAPMWEWHYILGYALGALVAWRIALFFTQSGRRSYQQLKKESFHKKIVKLGYLLIYVVLFFITVSGFVMYFYETIGLAKDTAHDIKEVHELFYYVLLYFVPLHVIGVFVAENRDEKGILSDMVNGGKQ